MVRAVELVVNREARRVGEEEKIIIKCKARPGTKGLIFVTVKFKREKAPTIKLAGEQV